MRLLFIADGRSPIALNWIQYFLDTGHEVHLISTYPFKTKLPFASYSWSAVAFSGVVRRTGSARPGKAPGGAGGIKLRAAIRHWLGPFTVLPAARELRDQVEDLEPDLIHAMRIPFEGMLAATINPSAPLIVSVWGNDFTLHAPASPWMGNLTRRTLFRADALHVDCHRDQRLALDWGYPQDQPLVVLPGAGGIKRDVFYHPSEVKSAQGERILDIVNGVPETAPVVVNPRGFRAYIRNDTFFKAIPLILQEKPETYFLCPTMAGEKQAEAWLEEYRIGHAVRLLPRLSPEEMAFVFRRAQVTVSPSEHDGTPNTLLEAMACGSFPVAGDIESIREWIDDGENGILIDPDQHEVLATAVLQALDDTDLRQRASAHNLRTIQERADYDKVMLEAEAFYSSLMS